MLKKVKDPSVDVNFPELSKLYTNSNESSLAANYWNESFWKVTEMFKRALDLTRGADRASRTKGQSKEAIYAVQRQ